MLNKAKRSLDKSDAPYKAQGSKKKVSNNYNYMSLKKVIQDLINHNEQHQKGPVLEKLLSCRECYPLPDFEADDLFVNF